MWAEALPNLLIGLREGLEAGLVVSILLAAVRRVEPSGWARSVLALWWGVAAAVVLALSFAAVLTFYRSVLSTAGQEALGGLLSVVAVVLVTGMVFWMRRTARSLSLELRAKVGDAMRVSAAAVALTAFVAVGREGVETALFLWTTAQVSGQTGAPVIGAGLGIGAAIVLCVLLYRSAVRIDLGRFFNRTAVVLIVIAAGVLAYGLGDLQDAGLLPGSSWVAFDLTRRIDPSSWWATLITGVTELSPAMTWLQVVAYLAYLGGVLTAFLRADPTRTGGRADGAEPAGDRGGSVARDGEQARQGSGRSRRVTVLLAGGALVVPPLLAVGLIVAAPGGGRQSAQPVQVTPAACAPGWSGTGAGSREFAVANKSGHTVEVDLVQAITQGVVAEIETLGPATTATMSATLAPGAYFFRCLADGLPATTSATVQAAGSDDGPGADAGAGAGAGAVSVPMAVKPVAVADLEPAATAYDGYVAPQLATLMGQVATVRSDIAAGQVAAARRDWLQAQLTWERVGAAYDSFADLGDVIDGLPQAHPGGVDDTGFTGLHRLEYGLWHDQPASVLLPVTDRLGADVTTLRGKLGQITVDPTDMPTRAHEILEDALRDHLNGLTDEGAQAAYPETWADVQGTHTVLDELAPLITDRDPTLLPEVNAQLDALTRALLATQAARSWQPVSAVPLPARERVDAAIGAVLENLALVPDLLEVPAH